MGYFYTGTTHGGNCPECGSGLVTQKRDVGEQKSCINGECDWSYRQY